MADIALVTGAAGALGSEIARTLARRGARLVLLDRPRHEARLRELSASVGGIFATGDLGDEAVWSALRDRIPRELGGPATLAAFVAGGYRGGTPLHAETDDTTWRAMMTDNVDTVYRGLRAVLPPMVAAGRGSVVVVGSRAVERPETSAGAAAYAASKAAVVALARAVAAEVSGHGVRVNAVLPSTMDTPANRAAMPDADPTRWVSLASAAAVVAFLLSDEARDIRGAAVPVYGGA